MRTISMLLSAVLSMALMATPAFAVSTAPAAGTTEGTGTAFAVTDSLGQTYTIQSTAEISLTAEAIAIDTRSMVSLYLQPAGTTTATTLTLGGLIPGKDYHLYVGADSIHSILPASASGTLSLAVDLEETRFIVLKTWPSTLYIGGTNGINCESIGTWGYYDQPDGKRIYTCQLTKDVYDNPLVILNDNIILDGNGHKWVGTGPGTAVSMTAKNNITVKNLAIENAFYGISSKTNTISGNTFTGNTIKNCSYGIYMLNSYYNTVSGNNISECWKGIHFTSFLSGTFSSNNIRSGGTSSPIQPGVYIYSSGLNTFQDNTINNNPSDGLFLGGNSTQNTFINNTIKENAGSGITVSYSNSNTFYGNTIQDNSVSGLSLLSSPAQNIFYNNNFSNTLNVTGSIPLDNGNPVVTWNIDPINPPALDPPLPSTNIIGGPSLGGNFWGKPTGNGWSETCADAVPRDGFCDTPYPVGTDINKNLGEDSLPLALNSPPVITNVDPNITLGMEGLPLAFNLAATDPEGDKLTYSAAPLPPGASIDKDSGLFIWTPGYDQAGEYEIIFQVADDGVPSAVAFKPVTLSIGNINRAPVLTATWPQTVDPGELISFTINVVDPDDDAFAMSVSGLPAGSNFNADSGTFTWTPVESDSGSHTFTFFATDEYNPSATGQLEVNITVNTIVNTSPTELMNQLITTIRGLNLSKELENSYLANLKKVNFFIEKGKVGAAINQVQAFIHKVEQDMLHGQITEPGNDMIFKAEYVISLLTPRG